MPTLLKLAVSQSHTQNTLAETLQQLRSTTHTAASQGVDILLFPEAYLGGYPRTCSFGAAIGSRSDEGREQFLAYFKNAVDLGDTPLGAGDEWVQRRLGVNSESGKRGDGTREVLEEVARETGVFVVTGVVEKAGGSLFCAAVYVCPKRGVIGKRRKLMPTGTERLVWSQGTASSLKAVTATIKGVKVVMGCAICWENLMPLLRYSLYSQNVNLWLAPTADPRESWGSLMRTVGMEGRCFVMSANQCQRRNELPSWITGKLKVANEVRPAGSTALSRRRSIMTEDDHEIAMPASCMKEHAQVNGDAVVDDSKAEESDYVSRGGSCIASPMGSFVREPVWENSKDLIIAEVDFEDCARGKLDFDAAGHYSRSDQFRLTTLGLDLNPPA